jgi:hypothetical protein
MAAFASLTVFGVLTIAILAQKDIEFRFRDFTLKIRGQSEPPSLPPSD